jgi:hypothetical protein
VISNQIAWCLAQLGEPAKALELAQSVLAQLESMGPQFTASGHLVIGASCLFLGMPGEAVSLTPPEIHAANLQNFISVTSLDSTLADHVLSAGNKRLAENLSPLVTKNTGGGGVMVNQTSMKDVCPETTTVVWESRFIGREGSLFHQSAHHPLGSVDFQP